MAATIHVVGSMMIDRVSRVRALPRGGETVLALSASTFAGGKGANQAAAAARCGARVRMLGRTGSDGAFIAQALESAGVDIEFISTADEVSGAASVLVAENGENAIVIAPESNARIVMPDIEVFLESARQGDIVLLQNECSCLHEGIAHAASRALRVWFNAAPADPSLRALRFEKLTGLVVNETEAEALTGERDPARALEALAGRMPGGTVIVTLGAAGAIAAAGRARYAHRGFEVEAVDTVGCGDAFVGAYLAAIATGRDIAQALARGNAAGALAAMRAGAMPSLPLSEEIDLTAALPERTRLKPRAPDEPSAAMPRRCTSCRYDLTGKAAGERCPECGREIVPLTRGVGPVDVRELHRLGRAARILFASAILLALAPALGRLTDLSAFVAVFVFAAAQISLQFAATWTFASATSQPNRRRSMRGIALVRATAFALGQLLYPALVLLDWAPLDGVVALLTHPQIVPLFVLPAPLVVLAADVLLLWRMRDVTAFTGANAAQPWRGAASKARVAILLALPIAIVFAPTGYEYLPTMWGVCLAIGAMEVLGAAKVAAHRIGRPSKRGPRGGADA